jgi:nucleoside-diphosphate-sugar epimerase
VYDAAVVAELAALVAEVAALVADVVSPGKSIVIHGAPAADNAQRNRYVPSIAKAQKQLGLSLSVSLSEAVRRAAESHKHCKRYAKRLWRA